MMISELPKFKGQNKFHLLHYHLDTDQIFETKDQPLVELGVGGSTSTTYRLLPPVAKMFLARMRQRLDLLHLAEFSTLDEALEWVQGDSASKATQQRFKVVEKKGKDFDSVQDLIGMMSQSDTITVLEEIVAHANEHGLDTEGIPDLIQSLASKERFQEVIRRLEALQPVSPAKGEKKEKVYSFGPNTRLVLWWGGKAVHEMEVSRHWHRPPKEESKKVLVPSLRDGVGICIRCNELKQFPERAKAKYYSARPGAALAKDNLDAVRWGIKGAYNDRICLECWETDIAPSLHDVITNKTETLSPNKGTELALHMSVFSDDQGDSIDQELLELHVVSDAEEFQRILKAALGKSRRHIGDPGAMSTGIRVVLWSIENATWHIRHFWRMSHSDIINALTTFSRRFPSNSFKTLVRVSSRPKYIDNKWEVRPGSRDWIRWVQRLFRGTPVSRTEAVQVLQLHDTIMFRKIPCSEWILRTGEKIMSDYVKADPTSPGFLLGKLYRVCEELAAYCGDKDTRNQRRNVMFRKFYKALRSQPTRRVQGLREHMDLLLRKSRGGIPELREVMEATWDELSQVGIPKEMSLEDHIQYTMGLVAARKSLVSAWVKFRVRKPVKDPKNPNENDSPKGDPEVSGEEVQEAIDTLSSGTEDEDEGSLM